MIKYICGKKFERATKGSAGFDIVSAENIELLPNETKLIKTTLYLELNENIYGKIETRSSMALKSITVEGGIIDSDYRGEVKVILKNSSNVKYIINENDRIAQIIFNNYISNIINSNTLSLSERNENGFGSTGK